MEVNVQVRPKAVITGSNRKQFRLQKYFSKKFAHEHSSYINFDLPPYFEPTLTNAKFLKQPQKFTDSRQHSINSRDQLDPRNYMTNVTRG